MKNKKYYLYLLKYVVIIGLEAFFFCMTFSLTVLIKKTSNRILGLSI